MRFLYLIFSHDNADQIRRLACAIRQLCPGSLIALHHDPTHCIVDQSLFSGIEDVYCIPEPVRGEWGGFSLVEQHLHSLRWCRDNLSFDWLISITGLSYPIMPLRVFEETLVRSEYDAYCYHFDAFDPDHWPVGEAEKRYSFWYISIPKFRYWHKVPLSLSKKFSLFRIWINRVQPFFRFIPMPKGVRSKLGFRRIWMPIGKHFRLYGGRLALTINRRTIERILEFVEMNPWWMRYQRRTLIPDESFFNSIIANDLELRVANSLLRYVKWPKLHAARGGVIEAQEVENALESGEPFGLKFDSRVDPEAINKVDARLGIASTGAELRSAEGGQAAC